jgi:glucose-1-phosphatase
LKDSIDHIVFDLGGVIYDIDHTLTAAAFDALTGKRGKEGFITRFSFVAQHPVFTDYEQGFISSEEFRSALQKELAITVSPKEFDNAWNAILKEIPAPRLQLLRRLKTAYRISLLSNTNAIHLDMVNKYLREEHQISDLDSLFHKAYYSFKLGMRKPNRDIFEFVLKDSGSDPGRTLFIDDSKPNVDAADAVGYKTVHLTGIDIVEALKDF